VSQSLVMHMAVININLAEYHVTNTGESFTKTTLRHLHVTSFNT